MHRAGRMWNLQNAKPAGYEVSLFCVSFLDLVHRL